ncbi:hypothetical protein G7046_g1689 [Stylonectria norvegica]|nr:hypothetical protein G7046_g1689 [Stylonectria norvegica]
MPDCEQEADYDEAGADRQTTDAEDDGDDKKHDSEQEYEKNESDGRSEEEKQIEADNDGEQQGGNQEEPEGIEVGKPPTQLLGALECVRPSKQKSNPTAQRRRNPKRQDSGSGFDAEPDPDEDRFPHLHQKPDQDLRQTSDEESGELSVNVMDENPSQASDHDSNQDSDGYLTQYSYQDFESSTRTRAHEAVSQGHARVLVPVDVFDAGWPTSAQKTSHSNWPQNLGFILRQSCPNRRAVAHADQATRRLHTYNSMKDLDLNLTIVQDWMKANTSYQMEHIIEALSPEQATEIPPC